MASILTENFHENLEIKESQLSNRNIIHHENDDSICDMTGIDEVVYQDQ